MSITINGITCEEIVRNYTEGADLRGVSSRKGYLCNWTDRFTVARGLLGYTSTTAVGGTVTLVTPRAHPELYNCYCVGVELEPVGKPSQGGTQLAFDKCIVWGLYGSLNFSWGADPFMNIDPSTPFVYAEQEISISTEVITVPGRFLKFSGGSTLLHDSYGLKIGLVDFSITLHRVPYMPSGSSILTLGGGINNATYLGIAAGYLLFNGLQNRGQFLSDGTFTQDLTYSFTARTQPWDYAYNGKASAWQKVVRIDGSDFYTRQSFAGLMPGDYY